MSDSFDEQKRQSEKRRLDYKLFCMERDMENLSRYVESHNSEDESWSHEDVAEAVREQLQPLENRISQLEAMVKELLKAHVPSLVQDAKT